MAKRRLPEGACLLDQSSRNRSGEHFPSRSFGGGISHTLMLYFSVLVACSVVLRGGHAVPRTVARRYKPVIHVTEEIDINDITFTTSAPEFERSASLRKANYFSGAGKGVFPQGNYGAGTSSEKVYATGQPIVVPLAKYKPYKVFKVQDGFRHGKAKPKVQEKSKLLTFGPPAAFDGPETHRQNSKLVAFSTPLSAIQPTRTSAFPTQENKSFIPSPTFSPAVLALINSENNQKFSESPDVASFASQKTIDRPKPTKKPYRVKTTHQSAGAGGEDFATTSEKLDEKLGLHREAPQESESFLSEISTISKDGGGPEGLEGMAEALDLKTGERVEFQMYGMDGPQSYKFGFDTGKGHNRHFRFEERDNTGKVKGHYGYLDEDGKMRIMKYEADPVTGFHAGPVEFSPEAN